MNGSITKNELMETVAGHTGLSVDTLKECYSVLGSEVSERLAKGQRIEIRNFCSLKAVISENVKVRNPKNGENSIIPARLVVRFKPSDKTTIVHREE